MILRRYLALAFFKTCGAVLFILLALFSFLSLGEELEQVGKGSFGTADAFSVMLLTTPRLMLELLPVTLAIGSITALGILLNHGELTAMRAAGISTARLTRMMATLATGVAIWSVATQLWIVPASEREAHEFRTLTLEQSALGNREFWSLQEKQLLRVGAVAYGRVPLDLEIYTLDERSQLESVLTAKRAEILSQRQWRLHDATRKVIGYDSVVEENEALLIWDSILNSDQLDTLVSSPESLSPLELYRFLTDTSHFDLDTSEYELLLWRQVSLPITLLAMTIMGIPIVLAGGHPRAVGVQGLTGAGIGLAFYLLERAAPHLGTLLAIPPAVTALTPPLLVLCGAALALRSVR